MSKENIPKNAKESLRYKGLYLTPEGDAYRESGVKLKKYVNTFKSNSSTKSISEYNMIHYEKNIIRVHKEIALCFVPGYKEGLVVQHIDGNTLNDRADNLKWAKRNDITYNSWTNDEERKEQMHNRMIKQHADGKMKKHLNKLHDGMNERMKKLWEDPVYREKTILGMKKSWEKRKTKEK